MDRENFIEQVLAAEQTMYRVSKSILRHDWDCEDAVQEAVLKAYASAGRLKNEQYFKTWLIRIVINECYRILNSRKKFSSFDEVPEGVQAEQEPYSELYNAIHTLDKRYRVAVVLHYIEGYSVAEIGKILKIPSGTVKSRLSKARALLKKQIERS